MKRLSLLHNSVICTRAIPLTISTFLGHEEYCHNRGTGVFSGFFFDNHIIMLSIPRVDVRSAGKIILHCIILQKCENVFAKDLPSSGMGKEQTPAF